MVMDEIKKNIKYEKKELKKVQNFVPQIGYRETHSDPVKTKQNTAMTVYQLFVRIQKVIFRNRESTL